MQRVIDSLVIFFNKGLAELAGLSEEFYKEMLQLLINIDMDCRMLSAYVLKFITQ